MDKEAYESFLQVEYDSQDEETARPKSHLLLFILKASE